MLVMTTIFISKMEGLPPTSDIKMIDIWLVLCQMVPFVEVVLLTAMEYQRKDPSEEEAAKEMIVVNRVAGLGRLSAGAKMAMKPFVKRVFTIFATNASFLRVISNFRI